MKAVQTNITFWPKLLLVYGKIKCAIAAFWTQFFSDERLYVVLIWVWTQERWLTICSSHAHNSCLLMPKHCSPNSLALVRPVFTECTDTGQDKATLSDKVSWKETKNEYLRISPKWWYMRKTRCPPFSSWRRSPARFQSPVM